jgi:hypothetical protein
MAIEAELREKLRKIETLSPGPEPPVNGRPRKQR